ncbi:MAG TPA: twin-arginine translocase subunit TatC [Streptosporangiaceae bacterium]|nr:twin-arginine translocase subunit TatC [Streptosporangiaceae bacterium]
MEHLRELRNRVIKIALAVTVGSIVGWFVYGPVWNFISAPYCKLPQPKGFGTLVLHQSCQLYVNGLFDSLFLKLQISIATGVILAAPIWLYQVWAFIAPGLYRRERRWAYYFVGAAIPLFAIGATIAYFAMTKGLHFLLGLVPKHTTALITINTYLGYAGAMLLIFGIAFELPLVFVMLNMAGVLTHERFRKWRRMIIFLVFAFAAIFTPSPDPISMLLLALPCVVLVEASEVFAWANDRRRAKSGSLAFPGLTDAEVAAYGLDTPLDEHADAGTSAPAN